MAHWSADSLLSGARRRAAATARGRSDLAGRGRHRVLRPAPGGAVLSTIRAGVPTRGFRTVIRSAGRSRAVRRAGAGASGNPHGDRARLTTSHNLSTGNPQVLPACAFDTG